MSDPPRKPPQRIRVTKLQEAQLLDLCAIEARCAEMYYQVGFTAEEVAPRLDVDIARFTRTHDVLVAEADDQPAGYLAWADEAPGVAHLATLLVSPALPDWHVELTRRSLGPRDGRFDGESDAKVASKTLSTRVQGVRH